MSDVAAQPLEFPTLRTVFAIMGDEEDTLDSVWTTEEAALARCVELGDQSFVTEYRLDTTEPWVRNGWAPPRDPIVWSDWGGSGA